ncbi:MAG TPA: right-handed parallel beta-helix repeat-containing protein [Symbiobacteriaceae bacterium]
MAILKVPALFPTITAAVAAAAQGDVILVADGVYNEVVVVIGPEKNFIRIVADGEDAILDGQGTLASAFLLAGTTGVEIKGFWVQRYDGPGIFVAGGEANRIIGNTFDPDMDRDNAIIGNRLFGNRGLGIFGIGVNTLILDNRSAFSEAEGIRTAANAVALGNVSDQNGEDGILMFNTNAAVLDNDLSNNRLFGIAVLGSFHLIEQNVATNNAYAGIGLLIRRTAATNNSVIRNRMAGNTPVDLLVENPDNNNLVQNQCTTSSPSGLCNP